MHPDSENSRRLLVAAGTAHYDHHPTLEAVPGEIQQISDLFFELGYERCLCEHSLNPSISLLRENLPKWSLTHNKDDIAIFYYTSHGTSDDDRFYLLTHDSNDSDLDTSSIPAEELARWISKKSCAKQILVILDACYSGRGAAEFLSVASKVSNAVGSKSAFYVIAAARPKEEASQGALSSALETTLSNADGRLGGVTQQFLALEDVMESLNSCLSRHSSFQTATLSSANVSGRSRFFPNPRFRSQVQPGLDLETQRTLLEHWIPKAMGAEIGDVGWYFTGRHAALEEIVTWLTGDLFDSRTRVVTGGPGSGKSALIARIVTLSNPSTRGAALATGGCAVKTTTIPPENVIDVAIHARRKTVVDITRLVGEPLGITATCPRELLMFLEKRPGKAVLVLDALDEADNYSDTISQLLKPLNALPNVFLLIGSRPEATEIGRRFQSLSSTVEIDLDQLRYFKSSDIERYVERRLLCEEEPSRPTPYRNLPELAHAVAKGIADRAGNVFLIARTVVQSLLTADNAIDISTSTWTESLPSGIEAAFEQFFSKFDRIEDKSISSEIARAVLLPLAYAEGEGLPWGGIWSPVATALSGMPVSDDDIASVLRHAAPFIVEALEVEQSVYRLYHEELARFLRAQTSDADAEEAFIDALLSLVPREKDQLQWDRVHQPYLLAHLSTHASKVSGLLDTLIVDPQYLIRSDSVRLLASINRSEGEPCHSEVAGAMRDIYRLGQHHLRRTLDPDECAAYLELMAHSQRTHHVMRAFGTMNLQSPWRVLWARSRRKSIHVTLEGHTSDVTAVAVGELMDGRRVTISGSADGTVRVWDLETGAPIGAPLEGHTEHVTSLAVGKCGDGRQVIISGSDDGTVRVWDLDTHALIGAPLKGHKDSINAVAVGERRGGRRVVVSGSDDQTIRLWDLDTGAPIGAPLKGHKNSVTAVAVGRRRDGRRVIISGSRDKTVRVWDLDSKAQIGAPLKRHESSVTAVAVGECHDGRRVIVSGSSDETVQVWDLDTKAPIGAPLEGHKHSVISIAVGECWDGRRVIVSGSRDRTVRVWDLETQRPVGTPLEGHASCVTAVAVGERRDGQRVVVSGSEDETVRVWDLEIKAPVGPPHEGHTSPIRAVTLAECRDGQWVIISGSEDRTVRVWELETGAPIGAPLKGHAASVITVAVGELQDGRRVIVSGSDDETMRVWDLETRTQIGESLEGHTSSVSAVTVGERQDGRRVIVSGSHDETVRVWDLETRTQIGSPLLAFLQHVIHVAVEKISDGRRVIISTDSAGTQVWGLNLRSGAPTVKHIRASCLSVAVGKCGDGRTVIVLGTWMGTVSLWDVETAERIRVYREGHAAICSVAVGKRTDGRRVVISGSTDEKVRVWDMDTGELLTTIQVPANISINLLNGTLLLITDSDFFALRI